MKTDPLNYAIQTKRKSTLPNNIIADGFESAKEALQFFDAEVGTKARVVRIVAQTGAILPQTKWLEPFI